MLVLAALITLFCIAINQIFNKKITLNLKICLLILKIFNKFAKYSLSKLKFYTNYYEYNQKISQV